MYSERIETKLSKKLEKQYNDECYSGATSYLFNKSHQLMERNLPEKEFKNILEIGAGMHPHYKYIKHKFKNYYCCENSKFAINFLKKKFPKIKTYYLSSDKFTINKKFDRIILSHSLEHIYKPEALLKKLYSLLNNNGVISIAIPTDPALMYRFMRFFKKKFFTKYKISESEYDYINAIEHINSYYNNKAIIKYHFNSFRQYYYPFNFLPAELNIFSFYQIYKR
jgi:phosphatidylethanolamine/phosphatidyl-N-methylethanolamine N-methyltransferase